MAERSLNVAHRGASGYAPENTVAALDLSLGLGADALELDIQMTRDGVLVAFHDEVLGRTLSPSHPAAGRRIADCSLREVTSWDVGSWFNRVHPERARPHYCGQRVPTLEEVLLRYWGRAALVLELKRPDEHPGMTEALLELVDDYHVAAPNSGGPVVVASFSSKTLRSLRGSEPDLQLLQLLSERELDCGRHVEAAGREAIGVGLWAGAATIDLVLESHWLGLEVYVYTVNQPAEMRKMMSMGVDGVMTDFPDALKRVVAGDRRAVTA